MNLFLFIISFILVTILTPVGMIFTIIRSLFLLDSKYISKYYRKLAISLDQFGNVAMARFFNIVLITSEGHKFGDEDETISSVLGKNQLTETFLYLGCQLNKLLNKLDNNHSINSIEQ